jgi:hypothetical protein
MSDWRARADAVQSSFESSARREGRGYRVLCPFCVSSKTGRRDFSMSVTGAGLFHCHRCATGGKLREAPDPGALDAAEAEDAIREFAPPEGFVPFGSGDGLTAAELNDARGYVINRGMRSLRMVRATGVGAVPAWFACSDECICRTNADPDRARFKWCRFGGRVIVPVLADDGLTWFGFVGRDYTGKASMPYLYPPGMARGAHLYNSIALHEDSIEPVMVVEGVFDAIALWPDAVAVLGKPSHAHVDMLLASRRPVAIVLDGDAYDEARALAMRLRFDGQRAGVVQLPPKKDPDQMDLGWLKHEARECLDRPW